MDEMKNRSTIYDFIFDADVVDSCRIIISRWRLSNFKLAIETGRYAQPKLDREQRICRTCLVVEDEKHTLFECRLYNQVRAKYPQVFNGPHDVKSILNPKSRQDIYDVANILFQIEKIHEKFNP